MDRAKVSKINEISTPHYRFKKGIQTIGENNGTFLFSVCIVIQFNDARRNVKTRVRLKN